MLRNSELNASEFRTAGSMLREEFPEFTSDHTSRYSPVENEQHVKISVPHSIPKTLKADEGNGFSTALNDYDFKTMTLQ